MPGVHTLLSASASQPLPHASGPPTQPISQCTGAGFIPASLPAFFFLFLFLPFCLLNVDYFGSSFSTPHCINVRN